MKIVGGMSVIDCQVSGKPARMILDTASGAVCIFRNRMDRFGLSIVGTTSGGYTAAGQQKTPALSSFVIEFSPEKRVTAENASVLPEYTEAPDIDGIIGNPILIAMKATVDYARNVLVLKDPRQLSK